MVPPVDRDGCSRSVPAPPRGGAQPSPAEERDTWPSRPARPARGLPNGSRGLNGPARGEVQLARRDVVPGGAAELDGDGLAAAAVPELDGPAAVVEPLVAPLHERGERGEEVGALLGEAIALPCALAGLAVVLALEQALVDQLAQARGGR